MNILVTGGSRGIGAATVKYFAEQGNRVAFVYNQNDSAAEVVVSECGAYKIKAGKAIGLVTYCCCNR